MPALPRVDRIKTIYSAAAALNYGWKFTDFLKTPMYNGVSRYIPQLHRLITVSQVWKTDLESAHQDASNGSNSFQFATLSWDRSLVRKITFRFCKQSEGSVGVRNFIENKLISLGQQNPSVVIYTQPVRNANPIIRAEYGNGRIVQLNAKNMSMADVERDVNLLYSRSGEPVVKLESRQSSPTPSIQGEWTPMTWLPSRMNKAKLPDPEFSKHKTCNVTATEYLLEEQKRNENQ